MILPSPNNITDPTPFKKKGPPSRAAPFSYSYGCSYPRARSDSMVWSMSIIFCADSSMSMTKLSIRATK